MTLALASRGLYRWYTRPYLRAAGPGAPRSHFPSAPWHAPDPFSGDLGRTYRDWLDDRRPEDRRLWLVERTRGKPSPELVAPWLPDAIAEHYCIRATHVTTRIRVRLVERCR